MKKIFPILTLIILAASLPFIFQGVQQIQKFLSRASGKPANIVVDSQSIMDPINQNWRYFGQGGEESINMIAPVVSEVSGLSPHYIRIDHLYDHYTVVSREDDGLIFNFTELDSLVDTILQTGAKPFLSLSYMPPAIAQDGNITNAPSDWNEWALTVQRTIEHFSGKSQRNLSDIYYEVWNEPDLFGGWKVYGEKNYLTLYSYAVTGAKNAKNTNQFFIGGPATTALYKKWVDALLKNATEQNLRVDFLSWHRYTDKPTDFSSDIKNATKWIFNYPQFITIPKLITEWGIDSNNNGVYDTNQSAAHAAAVVRQSLFGLQQLYTFELVDGPDPNGNEYWGRWGLITHPSRGKTIKPRYHTFTLLNSMQGNLLKVTGEGSFVTGFATKDGTKIKLMLTNYDPDGIHTETVPITISGLPNGVYSLKQTMLPGTTTTLAQDVTAGAFQTSIFIPKSSILLLELTPQ